MRRFFRKDLKIYAPTAGKCRDIVHCEDKVFSAKMMGDGFLIEPTQQVVVSPCDGRIKALFPTKHAFGIEMYNGQEVMVHVGLDTVRLKGEGFRSSLQVGDRIRHGEPLVEFDMDYIRSQDIKIPVLVVLLQNFADNKKDHIGEMVKADTVVMEL